MSSEKSASLECRLLGELTDDAAARSTGSTHSRSEGTADSSTRLLTELIDDAQTAQRHVVAPGDVAQSSWPKYRAVVEVELACYCEIARSLQQSIGECADAVLSEQIQSLIRKALGATGHSVQETFLNSTDGGAVLAFESAEVASRFAEALHRAAQEHNLGKDVGLAQRHFRIGICSGEIVPERRTTTGGDFLGFVFAGKAVADAVRLETACRTGEVLICGETWAQLPASLRKLYGPEELVHGKRSEQIRVHRRRVIDPAP
jgi:class 3 adenylate cyclase